MSLTPNTRARICALCAMLASVLAFVACGSDSPGAIGPGFVSDNPFGNGNNGTGGSSSSGSSASSTSSGTGGSDPSRAIAEADIIQVSGPRLYALSQYGGLSVIDISAPDHLHLLGNYRSSGVPFEMYLRDSTVYAMFSGWESYTCDSSGCTWITTSHVEALDVADPSHIAKLGSFDLPGDISDSRTVGDILYVVTYENGYCYNCQTSPNTTITSLNVHDPASIGVVDRLSYTTPDVNGYGYWKRSISVNEDRMYVGGIDWDGTNAGHSTIQIIDISDPAGHLVKGASVVARGQIESRWQMDEKDGVLRVISQPGTWWAADVPALQTFSVTSAQEIVALAELPLVLPAQERLRSVRFDGDRAYAITAVQKDPLFTFDLSDPAHPAQVGQLEMPGWVYFMEPREDRLFALGYEQNNPAGSLAVSLFDVTSLASPTLLSRVNFGGSWSSLPEDQDRIQKAFNVDDASGAVFVPYSAWNYGGTSSRYGCGSYASGIQIIDFTRDTLTRRGVAPSRGGARRAFVANDRLFGVSDAQVSTFDIKNRDAPVQTSTVGLSANVTSSVVAGGNVVRLSDDWWTGAARLEIVPASDPSRFDPLGAFDLSILDANDPTTWCWGWSYWGAHVFAHGKMVYVVRTGGNYYYYEDGYPFGSTAKVAVIDISNPAAPKARGQLTFPLPLYYRWYGGVVSGGDDFVQSGSTIVFRSLSAPSYDPNTIETASLEVVDLSDPDNPARASLPLPDGYGHTALLADGSTVRTSHWSPLPGDPDRVRFYVDAIDVSSPASPSLVSANVPGSLLAYDAPSDRILTVDYARIVKTGITASACYQLFNYSAQFTYDDPLSYDYMNGLGTCVGLHRTLNLLDIEGTSASVLSQASIDDRLPLIQPILGEDRVFTSPGYYWYNGTGDQGPRMVVIGGMRAGSLEVVTETLASTAYASPAAAVGTKLVLLAYSPPGLSVLDATDLAHITYARKADLDGYAYSVTMKGDTALCSLGPWGLETIDLSN